MNPLAWGAAILAVFAGTAALGDVNQDGQTDAVDAALILQASAGYEDTIAASPHFWEGLSLPPTLVINRDGCTSGDFCAGHRAYFVPGDPPEVVVDAQASWATVMHELCHAHQYHVEPVDWEQSDEAIAFLEAAEEPAQWSIEHSTPVEFFAQMCASYFVRPAALRDNAPALYAFFQDEFE